MAKMPSSSSSSPLLPCETTGLLSGNTTKRTLGPCDNMEKSREPHPRRIIALFLSFVAMAVTVVPMILLCGLERQNESMPMMTSLTNTISKNYYEAESQQPSTTSSLAESFPSDFVWGTATSSYQIEGGMASRGVSIWDVFCHDDTTQGHIWNHSNADVGCDHYHLFRQDVQLLSQLEIPHYRFSISWPRILPNGTRNDHDDDGGINQEGIAFYNHLIDTLLAHNITPWITLYHWDLPQALQDRYGGWLGRDTVDAFGEYARICFAAFGDRVQHWITINEAWSVAVLGYNNGVHAPGHSHRPSTEPYLVGHHLLLAHATAAHIYHTEFSHHQQHKQQGQIGMSNCGDYRYPKDLNDLDSIDAAQRAMLFQMAWFTDPLIFGDYPKEMRDMLGDRLPQFTPEERDLLRSSTRRTMDFIGLNHYSSLLASKPLTIPTFGGYWADIRVDFSNHPTWTQTSMGWNVVPQGCREMLLWISQRYPNITIYITENGTSDSDDPDADDQATVALNIAIRNDVSRINYLHGYLHAVREGLELGVPVGGYFVWSLMDNFEWQYGYQRKFGIVHVDFDDKNTLQRTPKASALWYRNVIGNANKHQ